MNRMLMTLLPMSLFVLLLLLTMAMIVRGWTQRSRAALPADAPPAGRGLRLAQALVIFGTGTALLIFAGVFNGPLESIASMPEALRRLIWLATGLGLAGMLAAALVAYRGRTGVGVALAFGCVLAYGTLFEGAPSPLQSLTGTDRRVHYTIQLDPAIAGVELWINGVAMGKTPLRLTSEELAAKQIPLWDKAPDETERYQGDPTYWPTGRSTSTYNQWARFSLETPDATGSDRFKEYFVRMELDGRPLYAGGGSSGGGSGGAYVSDYTATISVFDPLREAQLARLLDAARQTDYRPGSDWFEAMRNLTPQSWDRLLALSAQEPAASRVLDAWAMRQYDLPATPTAALAWTILERIEAEADAAGEFSTATPAGRAIDLIAPALDPGRLMAAARDWLHRPLTHNLSWWTAGGALQFKGTRTDASRNAYPPRATVVAAAVRAWQRLHPEDSRVRELATELLRWKGENDLVLKIAAAWGGPEVERYLLRQDWRNPVEFGQGDWLKNSTFVRGIYINQWLYLLLNREGPSAQAFRKGHAEAAMDLADRLLGSHTISSMVEELQFLFRLTEPGRTGLAWQYWPRFQAKLQGPDPKTDQALAWQWHYLTKLEPPAAAREYLAAAEPLLRGEQHLWIESALKKLEPLPLERRLEILHAVQARLEAAIEAQTAREPQGGGVHALTNASSTVRVKLLEWGDPATMQAVMAALADPTAQPRDANPRWDRDRIRDWLIHQVPEHPLAALLKASPDPALRGLLAGAE